ncbi:hypothetical protein ARMSODRAFT_1061660 [Armillaria solidipes]|uniref:Uncharacterized protein n=1 Tax=Armillaria solidipes TaxID=1076256 RepID=A0A2H3AU21_9AGAR|nr:hypothetical protein ARMSODRAFT_1061660 [Armillaria solidipes]
MDAVPGNKEKLQACMGRKDRSAKGAFAGDNAASLFLQIGANRATCTGALVREREKRCSWSETGSLPTVPLEEIARLLQGRIFCDARTSGLLAPISTSEQVKKRPSTNPARGIPESQKLFVEGKRWSKGYGKPENQLTNEALVLSIGPVKVAREPPNDRVAGMETDDERTVWLWRLTMIASTITNGPVQFPHVCAPPVEMLGTLSTPDTNIPEADTNAQQFFGEIKSLKQLLFIRLQFFYRVLATFRLLKRSIDNMFDLRNTTIHSIALFPELPHHSLAVWINFEFFALNEHQNIALTRSPVSRTVAAGKIRNFAIIEVLFSLMRSKFTNPGSVRCSGGYGNYRWIRRCRAQTRQSPRPSVPSSMSNVQYGAKLKLDVPDNDIYISARPAPRFTS